MGPSLPCLVTPRSHPCTLSLLPPLPLAADPHLAAVRAGNPHICPVSSLIHHLLSHTNTLSLPARLLQQIRIRPLFEQAPLTCALALELAAQGRCRGCNFYRNEAVPQVRPGADYRT